ncbi:uncharacterized protein LOC112686838 [Sipha flava]|uniref:Uncharacterized protein LOC112686838 n=1 Tax=Sipha flava TaxID=143950 RepID=A0A8B8FW62_9HEMI|nr:uncharacterized protein LOC112686838 [Sipha flava]
MNLYIYLQCVFVNQFLFAYGRGHGDTYDLYVADNNGIADGLPMVPQGYKYVPLIKVIANYDPNKYRITSYGAAIYGLNDGGLLRKKRGFFSSVSNLFKQSDVQPTDPPTVTAATATEIDGDVKTVKTTDGAVVVTDETVDDDADSGQTTTMDSLKSQLVNIVDVGKDVHNSLVVAAPYLPIVFKVATFVVPSLSTYQVLVLSVNVATVTAQALQDYWDGKEVSHDAIQKLVMETLLSKRDTGATVHQYATNMYGSFKNLLSSFGHQKENANSSPEKETLEEMSHIEIPEIKNDVQEVQTVVTKKFVNGVEIPEIESIVAKNGHVIKRKLKNDELITAEPIEDSFFSILKNKITTFINKIRNSESSTSSASDDCSNDSDFIEFMDDMNDESDSNNSEESDEPIEINQELFDKVLEQAMNLQPEEIKNKNDEELVKYIDNYQTHFSDHFIESEFDPKNVFDFLVNSMKFDKNVTKNQKKELVTMLGKVTNYFIDKNLENNDEN